MFTQTQTAIFQNISTNPAVMLSPAVMISNWPADSSPFVTVRVTNILNIV